MKLLTKEIKKKLPPLYSQDDKDPKDIQVIVKFFTPDANATWYITEGNIQSDSDWMFFGLCDLGVGFPELGNVMLSELREVKGKLGLPVERDRHWKGTLEDAMREVGS